MLLQKILINNSITSFQFIFRTNIEIFRVWFAIFRVKLFMKKSRRSHVLSWKLVMKSIRKCNQTFFITEKHDDMLIRKLRRVNDLIDKINNIVDVEQNEIDDKEIEFEKFKTLFASKTCDEQDFRLIEIETRVSSSNRLRKSLFWTNWI